PGAPRTRRGARKPPCRRPFPPCPPGGSREVLMRTYPELVEIAVNHLVAGRSGSIGTIRVDAAQVEQLRHEVTPHPHAHHRLIVDEPRERGGTDAGPSPLQVFLAGALTCLLNQFIKLAMARRLAID